MNKYDRSFLRAPSPTAERSSLLWFACLICLCSSAASVEASEVSGEQSGIWRKSDSPILVTDDVVIPKGSALTIEPGTLVNFNSYWSSITVRGALNVSGATALPVVFTSVADNGGGSMGRDRF